MPIQFGVRAAMFGLGFWWLKVRRWVRAWRIWLCFCLTALQLQLRCAPSGGEDTRSNVIRHASLAPMVLVHGILSF